MKKVQGHMRAFTKEMNCSMELGWGGGPGEELS